MGCPVRRVLVVEDSDVLRKRLCELLARSGFEAVPAAHALAALVHLRGGDAPSLVLLDQVLPGASGMTVVAAMRRDPALARVPVVVMSGADPPAEDERAAGIAAWLRKPFEFATLLATVERHCPRAAE